jgi:F-type H+-transporting ATPase subunit b
MAAEKGMPQLHIPDFLPQLFWLAVWFVVLYLLMAKLGLPRIAATLQARRRRREDDLAEAGRLKDEAEAANLAFQRVMSEARARAQAVINEASARLAAEAAERQRQLAATLATQVEAAERRIAAGREQALAEVHGIAADVGRAMVEKLTGTAPDTVAMTAAVANAMAGRTG